MQECKMMHYAECRNLQFPEMPKPAEQRGSPKCNIADRHTGAKEKERKSNWTSFGNKDKGGVS